MRNDSQGVPLLSAVLQRHTVRTLTLAQPWATLVAVGAKNIETRSWSTTYTGPLAIHAAKRIPADAQATCDLEPFRQALCAAGYTCTPTAGHNAWGLPLGQVVALVWLQSVQRIAPGRLPEEPERFFGDYTPGRFAWRFSALYRLPAPVQARGALGLWEWRPPELFWQELRVHSCQNLNQILHQSRFCR